MVIIAVFWVLFAIAAITPLRVSVILLFASVPFGATTVVPGSTTILPYVAMSPLVIAKVFLSARNPTVLWDGLLNWRRLGFLTAFVVAALAITFTAPFLFPHARTLGLNSLRPEMLHFGSGNITQPLYLTISFLLCTAFYILLLSPQGRATLGTAILVGATVAILSGLIDIVAGKTPLLSLVRTANYSIIEGAEVGNLRRVIGFNSEASAFGALVVSFGGILLFMSPALWRGGKALLIQQILVVILIVMTVLSTSSSAYLGLVMLIILFVLRLVLKVIAPRSGPDRRAATYGIIALLLVLPLAGTFLISQPALVDRAATMIDDTLLKKGSSDSANERASWNRISLQGFTDTGGYGVGVGSTRTSSWVVAVLSSTGLLGAGLLLAFLARGFLAFLPRTNHGVHNAAIGARYAFLVVLLPAAVAGSLVDFGVFNALMFAMMAAAPKILTGAAPARPHIIRRPRRAPAVTD